MKQTFASQQSTKYSTTALARYVQSSSSRRVNHVSRLDWIGSSPAVDALVAMRAQGAEAVSLDTNNIWKCIRQQYGVRRSCTKRVVSNRSRPAGARDMVQGVDGPGSSAKIMPHKFAGINTQYTDTSCKTSSLSRLAVRYLQSGRVARRRR